jgi:hypothetical protein
MSPNRHQNHVIIIPEDDADRQIANGFCSSYQLGTRSRRVQVVNETGGWHNAVATLHRTYLPHLREFNQARVVLVIDFDSNASRGAEVLEGVPEEFRDRVFVIGSLTDPQDLARSFKKSLEEIGRDIADQCAEGTTQSLWDHDLLEHNQTEVVRLSNLVRPFLFDS